MRLSKLAATGIAIAVGALLVGLPASGQPVPPGFKICKELTEGGKVYQFGCFAPTTCCVDQCCPPGKICTSSGCITPHTAPPVPGLPPLSPAPGGTAKPPGPTAHPAYDCSACAARLLADVRTGWASGNLRAHVRQALAGYENCKLKASGECTQGDLQVRSLLACEQVFPPGAEVGYRSCIGQHIGSQ